MFYYCCRKAKTLEGLSKAAVEKPVATLTPDIANMALTTTVEIQGGDLQS